MSSEVEERQEPAPTLATDEVRNPFPGLRPFQEADAQLFFGREEHVERLLSRLQKHRLLAVLGGSGSGKSSLVLAGVLPRLHRGYRTATGSCWRITQMRPGRDPMGALATALARVRGAEEEDWADSEPFSEAAYGRALPSEPTTEELHTRQQLLTQLTHSSSGLMRAAQELHLEEDENLLLIVDQFEELFRFRELAAGQRYDTATAFVQLLLRASECSPIPIYVVFTMRSDYLGECVHFPGLPEAIDEGQYLVPLLNRDQRAEAIRGPVAIAGAQISTALVQTLLNEAAEVTDQLPVMQHALMRTFELAQLDAAQHGGPLKLEPRHYEAAGAMKNALSQHADRAMEQLSQPSPEEAARITEWLFRCLTEPGLHGGGVRRPCQANTVLEVAHTTLETLKPIVAAFAQRGFLVQRPWGPLKPETTLDISHEALMRRWGSLSRWTAKEQTFGRRLQALHEAQLQHQRGERGLYQNPELALALKRRKRDQPSADVGARYNIDLVAIDRYLDRSAVAVKLRRRGVGLAVAAVICSLSLLGLFLFRSMKEAQAAREEAIDNAARARASEVEAQRAKYEALEATRRATEERTEAEIQKNSALRNREQASLREEEAKAAAEAAKNQVRLNEVLKREAQQKSKVAWEALSQQASFMNTQLLRVGTQRRRDPIVTQVLLREGTEGALLDPAWRKSVKQAVAEPFSKASNLDPLGDLRSALAVFSPDGEYVAVATRANQISVWRSDGSGREAVLGKHWSTVLSIEFDHTGRRLVTASADKTARIWNISPPGLVATLDRHQAAVRSASFSSDGQRVVTASADHTAAVWNAEGKLLRPLKGHAGAVLMARFSQDGEHIITASSDSTARVWEAHGTARATPLIGHLKGLFAAGFVPPSAVKGPERWRAISAGYDNTVRVWAPSARRRSSELKTWKTASRDATRVMAMHGERLMLAAKSGRIRLGSVTSEDWLTLSGHSGEARSVAFSPDGSRIVTGGADGVARVLDADGKFRVSLSGHNTGVRVVALSAHPRLLTVADDGATRVFSTQPLPRGLTVTPPSTTEQVVAVLAAEVQEPAIESETLTVAARSNSRVGLQQAERLRAALWQRVDYCLSPERRSQLLDMPGDISTKNARRCEQLRKACRGVSLEQCQQKVEAVLTPAGRAPTP